jgi:hypothetical protein
MKNIKLISTIACLGLLMSACSKSGSSGKSDDKQTVTPRAGQPSIPLGAGESQGLNQGSLNVKMNAEYARLLNVLPLDKAVQNNLYSIGSEAFIPAGILVARANVAVTYKDGGLEATLLNTTNQNYVVSLHSNNIEITDAYIIDESKGLSNENIHAGNVRRNTDVISSPETEPHNSIFVPENSKGDEGSIISSPDTEPSGSIFVEDDRISDNNQVQVNENREVISSPDTEPKGSIFTPRADNPQASIPTMAPEQVENTKPSLAFRGASLYNIADQVTLKCDQNRKKIINSIFTELSADEIVYDQDAIVSLKCIARDQPIILYNAILDALNYEKLPAIRVITAINSPLLNIVVVKADRELGLRLLKNTGTDDLHVKMVDINRAVNLLDDQKAYFDFDTETKEEIYLSLTRMAAAYKAPGDERYILRPLAKIMDRISDDRSALISFAKILKERDAKNEVAKKSATSLAKVILTAASRYASKDCKVYHLTSKQEASFQRALGKRTFERMLKWIKKNPTTRALDKNSKKSCDLR